MNTSQHAPLQSYCRRITVISAGLVLGAWLTCGHGQVTTVVQPDGTLGTAVNQNGTTYDITGGTRPGNGPNLFHSFEHFSVGTHDTARFSGPAGIANILSRVTGGQPSTIDGRLQSTIAGANLYLLNPSGVLFGPNAVLDVGGSFHVSTADYLRFADGAAFSAHLGEKSTLTVAPPAAFGFLGSAPAPVTIERSLLQVRPGQALSVVGGDVRLVGGELRAPIGRIHLASVASPGEVQFSPLELAPDLRADGFAHLGRLELSQGALLDVSGDGGGTVLLLSHSALIDRSNIFADNTGPMDGWGLGLDLQATADVVIRNGSFLTTDGLGAGHARNLRLTAGSVHVDGSVIGSRSHSFGDGGDVTFKVGKLMLTGGAQIDTNTHVSGRGGNLSVVATESISLTGGESGNGSAFYGNTFGSGDTGQIFISTPALVMDGGLIQGAVDGRGSGNANGITLEAGRLELTGGARIDSSSYGVGRGGDLTVTATDAVSIIGWDLMGNPSGLFSNTFSLGDGGRLSLSSHILTMDGGVIEAGTGQGSRGNGGSVEVRGGRLTLAGGSKINTYTLGSGRGGDLTVTATDAISISGPDSGLFSYTSFGSGNAGRLSVSAPSLAMDGGVIAALAGSGSGDAGEISVEAGRLMLTGGAVISSLATGSGKGGNVTVAATESISILGDEGKPSAVASFAVGEPGHLSLSAPIITIDNGAVGTPSLAIPDLTLGRGGNTSIKADHLTLRGGGGIASGTTTDNNGGDITIEAGRLTLSDGARLFSGTRGSGRGGNITVTASEVSLAGFLSGLFSNTEGSGDAGNINLRAGRLTLSDGAQLFSGTRGSGRGGDITVTASESLSITGLDSGLFSNTFSSGNAGQLFISTPRLTMDEGLIQAEAAPGSLGNTGDIELRLGRLTLTGGAQISNSTSGPGRGGRLVVTATDAISISGRNSRNNLSGLFSLANDRGDAGRLFISTPLLDMDDGRITTRTLGDGHAGDLEIQTGRLTLTGGAQILSSTGTLEFVNGVPIFRGTGGPGRGGTLTVTATDSVSIMGRSREGFRSGLFSNAQFGSGRGGDLFLSTPAMTMDDGLILASAERTSRGDAGNIFLEVGQLTLNGGAQISSSTSGPGRGGRVTVRAGDSITISGRNGEGDQSGILSDTRGAGTGGDLQVSAKRIQLRDGGTLSARSTGDGPAGTVRIEAGETFRSQNGAVTTEAARAGGGTIVLRAGRLVQLQDSELTTSVRGGGGDAGNLTIDAPFVVAEASQMAANAFGGQGGNVRIGGEVVLADPDSQVSASSTLGVQGTIDIQAPVTNLSSVVTPLPERMVSEAGLLRDRCAARLREGRVSSLVERGRAGVPATPDGVLPSRHTVMNTGASRAPETGRGAGGKTGSRQARRGDTLSWSSLIQARECADR